MAPPRRGPSLDYDSHRDRYYIRDYDDAGKRTKLRLGHGAADRPAAQKAFALYVLEKERVEAEKARIAPDAEDPANQDPRLVSIPACLTYYLQQQREGSSNATLAAYHTEHLLRHWGARMLSQIKGQTCRAYVAARTAERWVPPGGKGPGRPISVQTAGRELQTLGAAVGLWHKEFTLTSRPQVTLPEKGKAHPDWLTEAEYGRLLRVTQGWRWVSTDLATREPVWERAPDNPFVANWRSAAGEAYVHDDHLERFCEIGFYSGTRSGAILDLRWQRHRVDGHVDIPGLAIHRAGPEAPVSRKRQPRCRIHDRLLPRLVEWRKADAARTVPDGEGRPGPVTHVVHERGVPIQRVAKAFKAAALLAGLDRRDIDGVMRIGNPDPADDMGIPTPHILRHTRATLMLQAGLSPREVGEYLGMSTKMVEEVYGHHHVEYQTRAAAA